MDKIFESHIYKYSIDNYEKINEGLISEIYDLRKNNPQGVRKSNYGGGWHSDISNSKFTELSKIISKLFSEKVMNLNMDLNVSDIWANINPKGAANKPHNHDGSYFSGVYYIKVPENSGNLVFLNPFFYKYFLLDNLKENFYHQKILMELERYQKRYWSPGRSIEYKPKEGDAYFFI